MSAITGVYRPTSRVFSDWAHDWLRIINRWSRSDCRSHLAGQLILIMKKHGVAEAKEFRNYLLWLGCYPTVLRSER